MGRKEVPMKTRTIRPEHVGITVKITLIALSALSLAASLLHWTVLPFDPAWTAVLLCGVPMAAWAIYALAVNRTLRADLLVSSVLIIDLSAGKILAAGEIALVSALFSLFEEFAGKKELHAFEKLIRQKPIIARVIRPEGESIISADTVAVDDVLRVFPGETVPTDGVIIRGASSVDPSVLTEGSVPEEKSVGDTVLGGTVNRFGWFDMRADVCGKDSAIRRMIRLAESAEAGKGKLTGQRTSAMGGMRLSVIRTGNRV